MYVPCVIMVHTQLVRELSVTPVMICLLLLSVILRMVILFLVMQVITYLEPVVQIVRGKFLLVV